MELSKAQTDPCHIQVRWPVTCTFAPHHLKLKLCATTQPFDPLAFPWQISDDVGRRAVTLKSQNNNKLIIPRSHLLQHNVQVRIAAVI